MYARPALRDPGAERRAAPELLQGRHLRGPAGRRRAHVQPAGRRHHRPRQVRRPPHLRRDPRRGDVRRRLRRRRGPDVLHRRPAPRRPRRALLVRRRLARQPRDGRGRLGRHPLPQRRRAPGPVRPRRRRSTAPAGPSSSRTPPNFVAGINHRIAEIRANPLLMPGEYPLLGHPAGPEDFKVTDVISIASLVAGIFGKGGGNEVNSALCPAGGPEAVRPQGRAGGLARTSAAPTTPRRRPRSRARRSRTCRSPGTRWRRLPDRGSVVPHQVVTASTGPPRADSRDAGGKLPDIGDLLGGLASMNASSNALLVSRAEAEGGAPVAVFGPQVSYFTPQILIEMDIHAPGGPTGPPLDARGTAFPGTNLYVQLGHGRDYAWSATSAGQDITDTFAVPLCEPDGSKPTVESTGYRFRGECLPIEVLERVNTLDPVGRRHDAVGLGDAARRAHRARDRHPPGDDRRQAVRVHEAARDLFPRGRLGARLRRLQQPRADGVAEGVHAARRARSSTRSTGSSSTARHIAYFNSGINPVRAAKAHPDLPTPGKRKFEWQGWTPPSRAQLTGEPLSEANVDPRTNLSDTGALRRTSAGRRPART